MIGFFIESFVKGLGKATAAIVVCGIGSGLYYLGKTNVLNMIDTSGFVKLTTQAPKKLETTSESTQTQTQTSESESELDIATTQLLTSTSTSTSTTQTVSEESEINKDSESSYEEVKTFGWRHTNDARKFGRFYFGF